MADLSLIVTGANGRIGRLLRQQWLRQPPEGLSPVFLSRAEWDIERQEHPELGPTSGIILDLSTGRGNGIHANPSLAERVGAFADRAGLRLIYMSSGAVYGGGDSPQHEDMTPEPHSPYGHSKLMAEAAVKERCPSALILRLGNVIGADALFGSVDRSGSEELILDPISGGSRGPVRSYIGPMSLVKSMTQICRQFAKGAISNPIMNLAQRPAVAMADLLDAAERPWRFGPYREGVLERMVLSTDLLQRHIQISKASPETLVAELLELGRWP